jgi:hypothetical protein
VAGDEASPDIRAAQKALWDSGVALEGPDSDALRATCPRTGRKGCISAARACVSTQPAGWRKLRPGSTPDSPPTHAVRIPIPTEPQLPAAACLAPSTLRSLP